MKRVLIISPHFPPVNAPDMQRIRMSLPHYRSYDWEPVILTINDKCQEGIREPALLDSIPPEVKVIRIPAIPMRWARWIGLGNTGWRMLPYLLWHGSRLLRSEKFDLILFSNTQFITFPCGRLWRAWFGVPYLIDIQDPWRTDYYERSGSRRPPGGWKYQLARLQAWMLEGWSYRKAGAIMSVSPRYLADLAQRYSWFEAIPNAVICFGGSRSDLELALAQPLARPLYNRSGGQIHFLYTGASGPVMPHSLSVLFEGFRRYRTKHPTSAARFCFHFVGTSYVAPGKGIPSVIPVAEQATVADQVEEIAHRIGYLDAMRWMMEADVLLLPGSSDLAYSPSKLFPYYLSKHPILGIVFRNSVMEQQLDELNCATLIRVSENESKEQAYASLESFFEVVLAKFPPGSMPKRNDRIFEKLYLAEALTKRQCDLFAHASSSA